MNNTQPSGKRVIVIHSPHSGRSEQLQQALDYLQQAGAIICDIYSIVDLDTLPAQGVHWQAAGIEIAVAAGGDGLVGGVINHIAMCGMPLGILPLGTGNDIARSLAIPQDLREAAETIMHGHVRAVDIGMAQPAEQKPRHEDNQPLQVTPDALSPRALGFFAHALTVGLNVQFAHLATNVATRQRFGRMTYPFAALEVLLNPRVLEVQCTFDGLWLPDHSLPEPSAGTIAAQAVQMNYRALQVAVINAPIFGGQWNLSIPGASINDRLLDIVIVEDVELGQLGAAFARLFNPSQEDNDMLPGDERNTHYPPSLQQAELTGIPGVHHVQARGITIQTNDDPQDVTLDGEIRGQTPIRVQMAEQRLHVLVP
jgi:diacylglycerol kinase (ATP)